MAPQHARPGKQGLAALGYPQYTLRSTCVNVTVQVGWEDMWKEQLSLLQALYHFCSLAEGTCSPAQHPGNRCLGAALSHSATSQLEHYGVVSGPISTSALPFKGCWKGQGCATGSLSCRPLSFYPGMTCPISAPGQSQWSPYSKANTTNNQSQGPGNARAYG